MNGFKACLKMKMEEQRRFACGLKAEEFQDLSITEIKTTPVNQLESSFSLKLQIGSKKNDGTPIVSNEETN